jgi:hypothetical protein
MFLFTRPTESQLFVALLEFLDRMNWETFTIIESDTYRGKQSIIVRSDYLILFNCKGSMSPSFYYDYYTQNYTTNIESIETIDTTSQKTITSSCRSILMNVNLQNTSMIYFQGNSNVFFNCWSLSRLVTLLCFVFICQLNKTIRQQSVQGKPLTWILSESTYTDWILNNNSTSTLLSPGIFGITSREGYGPSYDSFLNSWRSTELQKL